MVNDNDTIELSNDVYKRTLDEITKKHLKTEFYKQKIEKGSSKGDNYVGIIYRVYVEAEDNGNNNANKMSIIIKVPPQNEIRRQQFFARPTFLREALAYNEVIPLLLSFQKNKGITSIVDGFFEVPHCYAALTDDKYEAIFLEDLLQRGFKMFDRLEDLDVNHARLVMKILGRLHAISFAMKDQVPEKFSKYKQLEDVFHSFESQFKEFLENSQQRAFDSISSSTTDQPLIDKMKEYFGKDNFMQLILKLVNGESAEPYAVLCHGDCWNNNVLYKYEDNKPIDACLLDWQILRYASPICDLMYFIFGSTTKELRDKHYFELMDLYHNELSKLLKKLGSDPEKIFPKKAFDQQLQKFGSFGFLMAVIILPFITSHADDVPDLDELAEKIKNGSLNSNEYLALEKSKAVYGKRMRDVVVDMVKLGYM